MSQVKFALVGCGRVSSRHVDALTNTFNRAEVDRVLVDLIRKYRQNGSSFSVIMCDLDHFKKINDTYGHSAGDEVLRTTARVLQEAFGQEIELTFFRRHPGDVTKRLERAGLHRHAELVRAPNSDGFESTPHAYVIARKDTN